MKWSLPKRALNKTFVFLGVFGVVFQLTAAVYAWWHGINLQSGWLLTLVAPMLCIASGIVPRLQLQKEPE